MVDQAIEKSANRVKYASDEEARVQAIGIDDVIRWEIEEREG